VVRSEDSTTPYKIGHHRLSIRGVAVDLQDDLANCSLPSLETTRGLLPSSNPVIRAGFSQDADGFIVDCRAPHADAATGGEFGECRQAGV